MAGDPNMAGDVAQPMGRDAIADQIHRPADCDTLPMLRPVPMGVDQCQ